MLNMSISEMLQEGGEASEVTTTLLQPISGNNVIQSFTTKNFSFLSEKQPELRAALLELQDKYSRA